MTSSYEEMDVQQLTDDELERISGGGDPDEGGQFHFHRNAPSFRFSLFGVPHA